MRRGFSWAHLGLIVIAIACGAAVWGGLSESNTPDPAVTQQQCDNMKSQEDATMAQANFAASERSWCTKP